MSKPALKSQFFCSLKRHRGNAGFSLVECIMALLILMVIALTVVSVFDISFRNNTTARRRFGALLLAQQRLEDVRNTPFNDLAVGTVTETNAVSDGVTYRVVRTITDNDLITTAAAPGPETRQITLTVSPADSPLPSDAVTLTTFRAVNRPGPNRKGNGE